LGKNKTFINISRQLNINQAQILKTVAFI